MIAPIVHKGEACAIGRPAQSPYRASHLERLLRFRTRVGQRNGPDLPPCQIGQYFAIGRNRRGIAIRDEARFASICAYRPYLLLKSPAGTMPGSVPDALDPASRHLGRR